MDPDLAGLRLRPELLAAGYTDDELRALRRAGDVATVRPGAYVAGTDERLRTPEHRHALAARAAVAQLPTGAVVSHVSAAVLHGLEVWGVPLDRVHLTRDRSSGGHRSRRSHVHTAPLEPDEIVAVGGVPVTSPARTVVDLARSVPFAHAVAVADGALFGRLVMQQDLADALDRAAHRPGNRRARRVVAFADAGGESVGESRSRVAMHEAGLPAPVLQRPVRSATGAELGRVDFWWPELRTVGEFDGRVKYGRLLRPGQQPGDVVYAEKLREDAIRDTGLRVVRWTWDEIAEFAVVVERLLRAFRAA